MNRSALKPIFVSLAVFGVIFAGVALYLINASQKSITTQNAAEQQVNAPSSMDPYKKTDLPVTKQVVGGDLKVVGNVNVVDGLTSSSVTITPLATASKLKAGQLYTDSDNSLRYFDGRSSMNVSGLKGAEGDINQLKTTLQALTSSQTSSGVVTLQGQSGEVVLTGGDGIAIEGTKVSNTGVTTIQGKSGNVVFSAGAGVSIMGTTIYNDGVTSIGGSTGDLSIGDGLGITGGALVNTGVTHLVSGSSDIVLTSNGSGTYTIGYSGSGAGGTVALGPSVAQVDSSTGPSIHINKTGSGNLLQLSTGTSPINRFVVDQAGAIIAGSMSFGSLTSVPSIVNSLAGTANQVSVSNASGSVTLSLPQSISVGSTPTFAGVNITGTAIAGSFSGDGAALTNVNAAQLGGQAGSYYLNAANLTGTLNDARLSTNVAKLDTAANFTSTLQQGGNNVCTTANNCNYLTGSAANGSYIQLQATSPGTAQTGNINISGSVLAGNFAGNGAGITNVNAAQLGGLGASYFLNATNITAGTLADARLSANVALVSGANFTGSLQQGGNPVCTSANNCGYLTGVSADGSYIQLQSGTPGVAQIGNLNITGTALANAFAGNGAALTDVNAAQLGGQGASYYLNATNIASGTLSDGRLSTNVALLNSATNNFTGTLQRNGNTVCDSTNNCGYLTGSAANGNYIQLQVVDPGVAQTGNLNITGIARAGTLYQNGSQVCDLSGNCAGVGGGIIGSGTVNTIAMFTSGGVIGDSLLTQSGSTISVTGNFTATNLAGNGASVTNVNAAQLGGQAGSYYQNATNLNTGTLADARLSSSVTLQGNAFNGSGQLVQLNGSGQLPAISGSLLTTLNAGNITLGTLADARLSTNIAKLDTAANFTSTLQQGGNNVCTTANNCNYLTGASANGSYVQLQAGTPGTAQTGNINITGTAIAGSFSGDGAALTNVNAAQLGGQAGSYYLNAANLTGTLNDARLSTNVAKLDTAANFTSTLQQGGNNVCTTANNCNYLTGSAANGSYIQLQATSPGTAQTGNINISGTAVAGVVQGTTINATSQLQINGTNINTAGTLSNVAYLTQANSFSGANTFNAATVVKANFSIQNAGDVNLLNADTIANTIVLGTETSGADTFTKIADPAVMPSGFVKNTAFSPDGQYMSFAHDLSPYVSIYKLSGGVFTKLPNPASLPAGSANGTAFSPDGQYMSVTHSSSPYVTIYKRSGDTFTKLANPTVLPSAYGLDVAFSPDSQYMAMVVNGVSPYINIYKRSGDTFTRLPDPATLPAGLASDLTFSPDGQYMSVAHATSPFITIYKRSGDTFTKLADPASLPPSGGRSVAFSPDSTYMSVAHATSPFITIYKRSGDTFTKLADPTTLPAGSGQATSFSPDGQYMSVAHATSPFITIYKRSGDTFTKLANPATLPTGQGISTSFSPDGQYMTVSITTAPTPYVTIYKIGDGLSVDLRMNGGFIRGGSADLKNLSVSGNTAVQGSLNVMGAVSIGQELVVSGAITAKANFSVQNASSVNLFEVDTSNSVVRVGTAGSGVDTSVKLPDPAILPSGTGDDTAFSPDGQYMSVAHSSSPYVTIYKRSGSTFTKLANPTTLPTGSGRGVAFSQDGQYMSVAHDISPYITIYKRSGDTFTKLADPTTLPTGSGRGVAFSQDGQYMSVAHSASPYITIYKRSGDTFTKLANPATLPPSPQANAVAFSPNGQYMSVSTTGAPYITIYKRSGDTFTKLADPATLPTDISYGNAFSPDGLYLSVAHNTSPYITIYKRSGDTFTKLANPASLPANNASAVAFSSDGKYMATAGAGSSTRIVVYKRSGDTFTRVTMAAPPDSGNGIAFSPDSRFYSVTQASSPYINIFKLGDGTGVDLDVSDSAIRGGAANLNWLNVSEGTYLRGALLANSNVTVGEGLAVGGEMTVVGAATLSGDTLIKTTTDSAIAFRIQNSAGSQTLFSSDTVNNRIVVGDGTGTGAATTTLVLDSAASDPTGIVGAMYYNTTDNVFKCYTTGWFSCSGTGAAVASGSGTSGRIAKFNASGQLADSNLSEASSTLTYSGNAIINAGSGFTGNLLDLRLNGISKLSVSESGSTSFTGNLRGTSDNTHFAVDDGSDRLGITKKSGGEPMLTYGSGATFRIAKSSGSSIAASNTFTTYFEIQNGGDANILTGALKTNGQIRIANDGTLQNVKLGSSAGALVTDSSGNISSANPGSAGQCLVSNGNSSTPSFGACGSSGWGLNGNSGTNGGTNFIGTTDAQDVVIKTNTGGGTYGQITIAGQNSSGTVTIKGGTGGGTLLAVTNNSNATLFQVTSGAGIQGAFRGSIGGTQACLSGTANGSSVIEIGGCSSSKEYKTGLAALSNSDYDDILSKIQGTDIYRYYHKTDSPDFQRTGVISEYMPAELTQTDQNGNPTPDWFSVYGYLWAGERALANKVGLLNTSQQSLASRVSALELQTGGSNSTINTQAVTTASLNVSGQTTLANLSVSHASVTGNLTVTGLTTVRNIVVNGHIITGGSTPIASVQAAGAEGSVEVNGNDTAGTITFTAGANGATSGQLLQVNFSEGFAKTPRIIISAQDASSVRAMAFPSNKTAAGFGLSTSEPLTPGAVYTFDYFIVE